MIIIMIASFIGSIAFAVLYRIPKRLLIISGLVGMLGIAIRNGSFICKSGDKILLVQQPRHLLVNSCSLIREPSILSLFWHFPLAWG